MGEGGRGGDRTAVLVLQAPGLNGILGHGCTGDWVRKYPLRGGRGGERETEVSAEISHDGKGTREKKKKHKTFHHHQSPGSRSPTPML